MRVTQESDGGLLLQGVAADGKVRSGRLTGDNEKNVARELRKQG